MNSTATVYNGSCHCHAIGFHYETDVDPERWSIRACKCSFCRAHDALSTSDPAARIEFFASKPGLLQRYRFGLKTTDFLLCSACGVYIGATIVTDKGRFGIINVRALNPPLGNPAPAKAMNYESENAASRTSRREQRWSIARMSPDVA
jgi:hypothetical protein